MENINTLFILFLVFVVVFFRVFTGLVEPAFVQIFNRPVYVHLYLRVLQLPLEQKSTLEDFSFYRRLPAGKKRFFEHRVRKVLKKYSFHGKGGFQMDENARILLACTFVMLTFGMRRYLIDVFDKIIVYPEEYLSPNGNMHKGEFNPNYKAVVFSWKHFGEGWNTNDDNYNVGIHEFAHALHFHGLHSSDHSAYLFSTMYQKIVREINHPPNRERLMKAGYFRQYAFTNQYEFLAVVLEHFFETPKQFRQNFPELYTNVQKMINFDASRLIG